MKHLKLLKIFAFVLLGGYCSPMLGMEVFAGDVGKEAVEEGAEDALSTVTKEGAADALQDVDEDVVREGSTEAVANTEKDAAENVAEEAEKAVAGEGLNKVARPGLAALKAPEEFLEDVGTDAVEEGAGDAAKEGAGDAAKEGEEVVEKEVPQSFLSKAVDKTIDFLYEGVLKQIFNSVIMMVPNIFQSAMLAQKERMVELQTWAAPLKFGDWVLQIPDSCINQNTPSSSFPIYVRIPVANVNDPINLATSKQFMNSVSGPTTSNAISSAMHTAGSDIMSLGGAASDNIARYKIENENVFYDKSGFVVSFSPAGSYGAPASSSLNSAQFTGLVVDLNTGLVMDAAAEINSGSTWPLLNLSSNGTDSHGVTSSATPAAIKDFLPLQLSKLGLSGSNVTYTQYQNVAAGSHGNSVSSALQQQFDCACISAESDAVSACTAGSCLLKKSLDAYKAGLYLNSQGGVGALPADANSNCLGSVVPLFGWGNKSLVNLTEFPNSTPVNATQFNLITALPKVKSNFWAPAGAKASSKQKSSVQQAAQIMYANPDFNYAAQGCWVYLCANTPFAQALQAMDKVNNKTGGVSVYGPLVDYIIFMDSTGQNQVSLFAPVVQPISKGSQVKWPVMRLNPQAKYWASLISSGVSAFDQQGGPVMYDFEMNPYANPALSGLVSAAIAELSSTKNPNTGATINTFVDLAAQFNIHSQAMLSKFYYGPFTYGNVKLTESTLNISVASQGAAPTTINLYQGMNCYGSSVADLLLPMDSGGNTVTLPSNSVATMHSVVTDIVYSIAKDGSLTPSDFSSAPLTQSGTKYAVNNQAVGTFNLLNTLSGSVGAPAVAAVEAYVQSQRTAWIDNFDSSGQLQGFNLGSLTFKLAADLSLKDVMTNGCFIYEAVPSPSAAVTNQDYYVLVAAGATQLESMTLLNVTSAPATSSVVSLLTGTVYDTQGNLVSTVTTSEVSSTQIIGEIICSYLCDKFADKGMSDVFKARYESWIKVYAQQMHRPMGPYSFGSLSLGIFVSDLAAQHYVYVPAAGMHSANFEPSDLFVTIDLSQPSPVFAQAFGANTVNMLSLVSGQLYDVNGAASILPQDKLLALTGQLSTKWGYWLTTNLKRLQQASVDSLSAQQQQQKDLDAELAGQAVDNKASLTPSDVTTIIQRLTPAGIAGLPAPFDSLKYDPVKQIYIRTASAGSQTDPTALLYQFFDVPNVSGTNGSVQTGAVFDQTGKQLRIISGIEQVAALDQYGIILNSDGTQSLGIPLLVPSLKLTDKDKQLVPGQNGESMIVSTSPQFPGKMKSFAAGYSLYFSKIMGTYYAFEKSSNQWIAIEGGHLYEKDGTPARSQHSVAKHGSDLMLLKKNTAGFMEGFINNQFYENKNNTSGTMQWVDGDGTSITVIQNKSVYAYGTNKYAVNTQYNWSDMILIPIDDTGNVLGTVPNPTYQNMSLVFKGDRVSHALFNNALYCVQGEAATSGQATASVAAASVPAAASASAATSGSATTVSAATAVPAVTSGTAKVSVKTSAKSSSKAKELTATAQVGSTVTMVNTSNTQKDVISIVFKMDSKTNAPYVEITSGLNSYKYGYVFDQLDSNQQAAYQLSTWKGAVVPCPVALPVGISSKVTKTFGKQSLTVSVPELATYLLFIKNIDVASLSKIAQVVGAPDSNSPQGQLFGLNMFRLLKSKNGRRFFATMYPNDDQDPSHAPVVSYFQDNGYVDLKTGALFNEKGVSEGFALRLDDLLAVLNKLQVMVIPDANNLDILVYRSAQNVAQQTATLSEDASKVVAS